MKRISSVKGKIGVNINFEKEVKCMDDDVNLFYQMVRTKPIPCVVSFSKLFKTMINMKHYSSVVSLFREMQQLGIPISGFILSSVINSYCLMHRVDCAFSVLPVYLKNGVSFDVVTFTTLLRGIFAENKVKDAVELFKKLVREKICEPNEVMYATVMNGLSKRGHTQKTLSLLRLMEQGNTKPNIFIYSIVVDALCKDGNSDAAINLLNEMKQKGLFEVGRIGAARKIYAEMLLAGPVPDLLTHGTLLNGYFKYGLVEEAMSLFNKLETKREDTSTSIEFYNVVINGLRKNGKLDKAHAIFEKLSLIGLLPNARTYNSMINGFCLEGLLDEANDVLRKMEESGCMPNDVTYNVFVRGYLRCNKISGMETFMKEMAGRGFSFDSTTTKLLVDVIRENPSVLDMIPKFRSEYKK